MPRIEHAQATELAKVEKQKFLLIGEFVDRNK